MRYAIMRYAIMRCVVMRRVVVSLRYAGMRCVDMDLKDIISSNLEVHHSPAPVQTDHQQSPWKLPAINK